MKVGWVSEIVKGTVKCIAAIAENQTTKQAFHSERSATDIDIKQNGTFMFIAVPLQIAAYFLDIPQGRFYLSREPGGILR